MNPIFVCGFECGVAAAAATGAAHVTSLTNASFSTSTVRNGTRSMRINPTAAQGLAPFNSPLAGSETVAVWRYAINVASNPTTNRAVGVVMTNGALTRIVGLGFKSSDSKYYPCEDDGTTCTLGSAGVTLSAGWHYVDCKVSVAANPWTIDVSVDGTPLTQLTRAIAAATLFGVDVGNRINSAVTCDYFVDDVVVSTTSANFPIGDGYVNHFVPTADGTHNVAGTGDFQRTLTGTDILNATTTAFQLVDEVPLEATVTDWINMLAPVNATDYVECIFGPAPGISTPTVAPRAVEIICGINQAATGAGNMEIRINDNGTTNALYSATGVAGVAVATGQVFKRKHYATAIAGGGAWVIGGGGNGDFTDLRIRFGSPAALDVNPDQYFGCAMVEAEFAAVVVTDKGEWQFYPAQQSHSVVNVIY